MALSTQPYKGARDFYPEQKRVQNYIFGVWRTVAESFGYQEYDASIVEPIELYLAKTSEEIVSQQTYTFMDRGGRNVTLRPEMTPTVSRMVAAKRQELAYPLRWFSIPNLWRYERPQRGRLREHWQLNVDLFGVSGVAGDHEIILLADAIMQRFGAKRDMYSIRLNSRELVNYILQQKYGLTTEKSLLAVRLIDRMNKVSQSDFVEDLKDIVGDKANELDAILRAGSLESLPEDVQNHDAAKRVAALQKILSDGGAHNAIFDISLMRGFDYYTDIVFEMFDTHPDNNRSLFGGGRYDGLVGLFGVEPVPTVGFGMGDVALKDFLETHKLLPELNSGVNVTVVLVGDVYAQAQSMLQTLRDAGINTALDATDRKLDKKLKSVTKSGCEIVMIVGEDEISQNMFTIKNLSTGIEQKLNIQDAIAYLLSQK